MFTLCPLFTAGALKFNLLLFLIQKRDLAGLLISATYNQRKRNTKQNGMDGCKGVCESFLKIKNPIQSM